MKKIITLFLSIFFLCISAPVEAQNSTAPRWKMTSGFGYYSPNDHTEGNIFFTEISYHLSTGYNVGLGFGLGDMFSEYEGTSVLEGTRIYENYYLIRAFINRPFTFGNQNNHQLQLGTGIVYIQPRYSKPLVRRVPVLDEQGNLIRYDVQISVSQSTSKSIDLGFPLIAEYEYEMGPLAAGIRGELYLLSTAGFGSFIIAPQISLQL